jgi:hypothetical protein
MLLVFLECYGTTNKLGAFWNPKVTKQTPPCSPPISSESMHDDRSYLYNTTLMCILLAIIFAHRCQSD